VLKEKKYVRCVICKHGQTKEGEVTITLNRGRCALVIRSVPAQVCENCGEQYLNAATTAKVLEAAGLAAQARVEVDVRSYRPA
jgi:YgiT-type zinc finger domain-containing protein